MSMVREMWINHGPAHEQLHRRCQSGIFFVVPYFLGAGEKTSWIKAIYKLLNLRREVCNSKGFEINSSVK